MIMNALRRTILKSGLALAVSALVSATGNVGPALAQEKVTLRWVLWDWDAIPYYKPLIDAYQAKNPHVTIEHVDLGSSDYQQLVATQLTGGARDLDIIAIKDVPNYANLVRAGSLLDLTSWFGEQKIDAASYGGLIEELTVDEKLHAIPFRSDFWIVYYNKRLFDAKGAAYPTNDMTFARHDELARSLTSGIGANKVYGTHFHIWRATVQLPGILDGKHTLAGPDYDFLKPWYERALKLQDDRIVASYATLKTSSTHYSAPFFNETIAMLPMGTWFIATQIAKVKSGESKASEWGIAALPHPEGVAAGTTAAQLSGLGVNANSTHKEAALDFVRFATGPEGAKIIAATGTIPALRDDAVVETIAALPGFPADPGSREALKTVKSYLELPVNRNAARIEVLLNRIHDAVMTKNITIDDGIAQMNREVGALN